MQFFSETEIADWSRYNSFFSSGQFRRTQTFQLAVLTIYSLRPLDKWKKFVCVLLYWSSAHDWRPLQSFGEYKMKKKREKESKKCRVPFFLHAANGAPNNKKQTALPDFMGNWVGTTTIVGHCKSQFQWKCRNHFRLQCLMGRGPLFFTTLVLLFKPKEQLQELAHQRITLHVTQTTQYLRHPSTLKGWNLVCATVPPDGQNLLSHNFSPVGPVVPEIWPNMWEKSQKKREKERVLKMTKKSRKIGHYS